MHELHLIRELMDDLVVRAGAEQAKRVTNVSIVLGLFTEIDPGIFRRYFDENSAGTLLQGAALEIHRSNRRELRLVSFDCE